MPGIKVAKRWGQPSGPRTSSELNYDQLNFNLVAVDTQSYNKSLPYPSHLEIEDPATPSKYERDHESLQDRRPFKGISNNTLPEMSEKRQVISPTRTLNSILTLNHRPLQLRMYRDSTRPTLRLTPIAKPTTPEPQIRTKTRTCRTPEARDEVSEHYFVDLPQVLTLTCSGHSIPSQRVQSEAAPSKTNEVQTASADDPSPPTLPIPS